MPNVSLSNYSSHPVKVPEDNITLKKILEDLFSPLSELNANHESLELFDGIQASDVNLGNPHASLDTIFNLDSILECR